MKVLAAAVLLGVPAGSFAEDSSVGTPIELGFREAIRMAGEMPASVIVSQERVQQAIARLGQARSGLMPQLSVTASETRQTKNLKAQGITLPGSRPLVGPFNAFDARLRLTQALFDAETLENLKMARTGRDFAFEQKRKVRQDAMALVAALYVEAKRAQEGLVLAKIQVERDRKELYVARTQFELGTGSKTDVDEAEARLAESGRLLAVKKAGATERRLDLLSALGLPVDHPIVFKEDLRLLFSGEPDVLTPEALESHPDVAVARKTVEQRQAQEGVVNAGYAPKISADADYGGSGADPSDSKATYQFGVRFSWPLFEGGQRQEKVAEAGHQVQEAKVQLEDTKLQTQARALRSLESVRKSWASVQANQAAFQVAKEELELARRRLDLGMGTEVEWVEQKARRAQSKDDLEEAAAAYQIARVGLAQALGRMEDLAQGAGKEGEHD